MFSHAIAASLFFLFFIVFEFHSTRQLSSMSSFILLTISASHYWLDRCWYCDTSLSMYPSESSICQQLLVLLITLFYWHNSLKYSWPSFHHPSWYTFCLWIDQILLVLCFMSKNIFFVSNWQCNMRWQNALTYDFWTFAPLVPQALSSLEVTGTHKFNDWFQLLWSCHLLLSIVVSVF